jgi:hypothetical protein
MGRKQKQNKNLSISPSVEDAMIKTATMKITVAFIFGMRWIYESRRPYRAFI